MILLIQEEIFCKSDKRFSNDCPKYLREVTIELESVFHIYILVMYTASLPLQISFNRTKEKSSLMNHDGR